jgi:thymidylate synthase
MRKDSDFLVIDADGCNDFYKDTLRSIIERGYEISPRGLPTKEIRPVMLIMKEPRERFLTCPGRLIHPFFQVMESIWILGGRGDVFFIEYYLENMKKYADNKVEFNAPYGTRMRLWNSHRDLVVFEQVVVRRDQFKDCYNALKKDPDTRQAIMVFWNPAFDHYEIETNDRPCNISFQFLIRNGKLDLSIFNRSNDLSWGLANTNVVQFSVILETMAMLLNIPVGNQIHFINSLHVYDFQGELTQRVLNAKYSFNVYKHVTPSYFKYFPDVEDVFDSLEREFELFFELESRIRYGEILLEPDLISFSYLKDALTLAKSFYFFKTEKYKLSVQALKDLNADDIFVTAMEFVARKADMADVIPVCMERFRRLKENSIKAILEYIREH